MQNLKVSNTSSLIVDAGSFSLLDELSRESQNLPYIFLGICAELIVVGRVPPSNAIKKAFECCLVTRIERNNRDDFRENNIIEGLIALLESAASVGVAKTKLQQFMNMHEWLKS